MADITDLAPKDCKHGVPDDVHCDGCAYEWEKSIIVTIAQQAERIERLTARMTLFENALGHIRWVKDCGIDTLNDDGTLHNYPADERDAMYEIAGKALRGEPCCADGKPESAPRAALTATAAPPSRKAQLQAVVDELVAIDDLEQGCIGVEDAHSVGMASGITPARVTRMYDELEARRPKLLQAARRLRSAEGTKG